jgi:hypothetical protein
MVKDPRSNKPGSSEPDEALDLLRALARSRGDQPPQPQAEPQPPPQGDEKLDALRALAEKLDLQLRSAPGGNQPGPPSSVPPATVPSRSPSPPPNLNDAPARAMWQDRIRETLRREWRALVAALPEAGSLMPRFGRPQIIHIGVSVGVLVIAAIGAIVGPRAPQSPSASTAPSTQVVPPLAPDAPANDLAAVTKAMSECDAEATKDPSSLHFLVLPLLPGKSAENDWRNLALQEVGNSFLLLSAKDALDGLRDGKLTVRPGRYTFAVLDSASGATYSWTSATSVSRLSRPVAQDVKSLKLGFDFSATQAGAQWSSEFRRDPGTCYWVSVLVRQ